MPKTRLAPSPTGALHLGNARTFLINWLLARQNNWQILLRIEDLDGPRIKPGADQLALEDLTWLGLKWDGAVRRQSEHMDDYSAALERLDRLGVTYPCFCSRRDIAAAQTAPHGPGTAYPGTCRGLSPNARAERIAAGRREGGRIIAVGTTTLRLLETAAAENGDVRPFAGDTRLFIMPGYRFRAIDLLLTNFHLPRSTLLMLVAALAGLERIKSAYSHAIARGYRFFSYGDACLIERPRFGCDTLTDADLSRTGH